MVLGRRIEPNEAQCHCRACTSALIPLAGHRYDRYLSITALVSSPLGGSKALQNSRSAGWPLECSNGIRPTSDIAPQSVNFDDRLYSSTTTSAQVHVKHHHSF